MPGLCGPGSPGLGRRRPPKTPAAIASGPEMRIFMAIPVFPFAAPERSIRTSDRTNRVRSPAIFERPRPARLRRWTVGGAPVNFFG